MSDVKARKERRSVIVLATGGTISSQGGAGQAKPTAKASDLLNDIKPLPPKVEVVDVIDVKHVISPALSLADMWDIVSAAEDLAASRTCDGIVITHGTATVIDTAFLAYLKWDTKVGLAFTGAMATANRVSRDGPRNLRDAILAAASLELSGVGPMVVANNLIHSPRFVKKTHKSAFDAFTSGQYGTFGFVDDDLVCVTGLIGAPPRLPGGAPDDDAVQLIKAVPGMSELLLRAALDAGSKGIVVDCLPGRGGVPPKLHSGLMSAIRHGLPVVLSGEADGRIKGNYSGLEHAAYYLGNGAISGGDLGPSRCRTLATHLLAGGADLVDIRKAFEEIAP